MDDDLVHCEKIGVSNFFWSFPSEAAVKLEAEAAKLDARLRAGQAERSSLEAQLAESRVGKEESVSLKRAPRPETAAASSPRAGALSAALLLHAAMLCERTRKYGIACVVTQDERRGLVQEADELAAVVEERKKELVQYSANDPERYEALSECSELACWMHGRWHTAAGTPQLTLRPAAKLQIASSLKYLERSYRHWSALSGCDDHRMRQLVKPLSGPLCCLPLQNKPRWWPATAPTAGPTTYLPSRRGCARSFRGWRAAWQISSGR